MTRPTLIVEIALSGNWVETSDANLSWTDISTYVIAVAYRRGRARPLETMQAGTCTIVLDNEDGRFTPGNIFSPYYLNPLDNGERGFRARRQVRVRQTTPTGSNFRGYMDSMTLDHQGLRVTMLCVDALRLFAERKESAGVFSVASPTNSRTYTDAVLDDIDWPVSWRANDGGTPTPVEVFSVSGRQAVLPWLQKAAASDLGAFFINGEGKSAWWHNDRFVTQASPVATFASQPSGSDVRPPIAYTLEEGDKNLYTSVTVNGTNSSVGLSSAGSALINRYGQRDITIDTLANSTDMPDDNTRAQQVIARFKHPKPIIDSVTFEGLVDDNTLWAHLTRDIGTTFRFRLSGYGVPATYLEQVGMVEGLDVAIDTRRSWRVTFLLSSIEGLVAGWFLGVSGLSELGQTTYLGSG